MFKRAIFWLNNSRLFSAPMTIMSWLVVFIYSIKHNGNIINGIIALVGILFAHLATNLFDDYVDYKKLSGNHVFRNNTSKNKCKYLQNGEATLSELLLVVIIYCSIAFTTGVYLTFHSGWGVILLAVIGGLITLSYAHLSTNGFSELAVGTAFGPLLFEGVYYVMCYQFSLDVFVISMAVVPFTIGLVYMNNLMDFNTDMQSGKKSLCCRIGNINLAAKGLLFIHFFGYFMFILYAVTTHKYLFVLPIITLPLAVIIYKLVIAYYSEDNNIYDNFIIKFILNRYKNLMQSQTGDFYIRLLLARNLMIFVSFIFIAVMFIYS